jgi:hypothetical protein
MKANKTNLRKLNPLNLSDLHQKLFMQGVIKFEDSTPSEWVNLFNNKYEYINDKKKIRDILRIDLKEEPIFIPEFLRIERGDHV